MVQRINLTMGGTHNPRERNTTRAELSLSPAHQGHTGPFFLFAPPTSAGTQLCVPCVLTSGACPCPAAEEAPRSAANAPAEKLR